MKVLMIERFLPESIYSVELGAELKKYCDLSVLCKRNVKPEHYPGFQWINCFYTDGQKKWLAPFDYFLSLCQLERQIRKGHYDVIHVQTFKSARYEMSVYKKTRNDYGKLVHTVHNILPHEAPEKDRKMYEDFYHFCDRLIVHNQATKDRLSGDFSIPEEKISVIAHGAYDTHMKSKRTKDQGKKNKQTYVCFGNIRHYKGIDLLLQAIALIPPSERKKMQFYIAGKQYPKLDGTDYKEMIYSLGIGDCVRFSNEFVPEDRISKLFERADVAIFPYREIYASGAMLMAYTYGTPVIASDIPVFREETENGKTGILFRAENVNELAKAILTSMNWTMEERQKFKSGIEDLIVTKYNWKKSARKTIKVYQK